MHGNAQGALIGTVPLPLPHFITFKVESGIMRTTTLRWYRTWLESFPLPQNQYPEHRFQPLNFDPISLNLKPAILNPKLKMLNFQPQTLNTQPSNLDEIRIHTLGERT